MNTKLTPDMVRMIRKERAKNCHKPKLRELAAKCGVSISAIANVLNGRYWGHVKQRGRTAK